MSKTFGTLVMIAALAASLGIVAAATGSGAAAGAFSVNVNYNSAVGNYLTTNNGYALYTNTQESAYGGTSSCYGACAQIWHAYYNSTLNLPSGLNSSSFGSINRTGGGKQLTYLGRPLYTYAGDTGQAQVSGNGIGGIWYVAKVANYAPVSSSPSTTKPGAITNSSSTGNGANTTAVGIAGNIQRSAENSTPNQSTTTVTTPANSTGGNNTLLYAVIIVVIIIIIVAAYFVVRKR